MDYFYLVFIVPRTVKDTVPSHKKISEQNLV